ncbi:MAG TPA: thiolase family protein [Bacillota bacterium]|jgi:acetyl-CoA acetyltransferase|nr:thiolase family protein [Bacillota bacterium]HOA36024.1 thiolase family protein [Bacillota bacterium]HOJ84512.1 thiolase family protein [Bacillota bacterium]HPZ12125.1 thiolase family protein [Bacillota bacterium]HQE10394.1 thiolase family protein [Bacillota bacterium]
MLKKAYIPYKGYYSTPFCKWQGSLQLDNAIELGAKTSKRWFESRGLDQKELDYLYLGITIGQHRVFFGATWAAFLMGAPDIPGMTIMQACSTATTTVFNAGAAVEMGNVNTAYCLLVDRCSNGPHTIWPNPLGPGGEVISENWNMDNMRADPSTNIGTLMTAENVAREQGFTREQADELVLIRYRQYDDALANDRAFQKRYMFPVEATVSRKETRLVEEDEGVPTTSKEALARLRPVVEGGILTFGGQTHPADGNAGIIVTTRERAAEMSADPNIEIQIVSYGYARAKKAFMPMAPVPAARMALERAGLTVKDMAAIKNHNPFIVNDLYLAKELGIDGASFNNYGSSMVFGHPQAPTMARMLIEAIEEAVIKGGGYAMATGCAAGDTAAALIVKVG